MRVGLVGLLARKKHTLLNFSRNDSDPGKVTRTGRRRRAATRGSTSGVITFAKKARRHVEFLDTPDDPGTQGDNPAPASFAK